MSDIEEDTCEGDRYDRERPCKQCKGKGTWVMFHLREPCDLCEGTGVDLHAGGYYDDREAED